MGFDATVDSIPGKVLLAAPLKDTQMQLSRLCYSTAVCSGIGTISKRETAGDHDGKADALLAKLQERDPTVVLVIRQLYLPSTTSRCESDIHDDAKSRAAFLG